MMKNREAFKRTYKFPGDREGDDFPVTFSDDLLEGLGVDFGVCVLYGGRVAPSWRGDDSWKTYVEKKKSSLLNLKQQYQLKRCVIL